MLFSAGLALALTVFSDLPGALAALGPKATFNIVNKNIAPDGFTRSTVLNNGVFPAPLLAAKKGSKFKINVINRLTDKTMERTTGIHWHGIFQRTKNPKQNTNYNDGASMVTQCPIVPGESYEYDFQVPGQAGTFWYHAHVSTQYCDGLRGPLVLYDPKDPHKHLYDCDDESTILTISDWYHNVSSQVSLPSISDSTLINGLGRFKGGPSTPLAVVSVTRGKRYRMRLIALACAPFYTFSIDGHTMTVIEADSVNVHPYVVNNITIFPAQRYSFVLTANQKVGNYWIRAEPRAGGDGGIPGYEGGINSAILRYAGAPVADPKTSIWSGSQVIPLEEGKLVPLSHAAAPGKPHPGGADVKLDLGLGFNTTSGEFTINNVSWAPPSVPVLLQILQGDTSAQTLLPHGSVYTLPPNKVIEVSIPPGQAGGDPHAFHLHGHDFSVVRTAGSSTYNYANPIRRDVVSTGVPGDNVTIRFVTDNSGPWLLHCHIDFHFNLGLAIVFAEDPVGIPKIDKPTHAWSELCPAFNKFESLQS